MTSVLLFLRAALKRLAEACMAALALLTLADVLGRYVFNVSVVGAVELTEILMVGVIFSGVVLATLGREHVAVDLLPMPFGATGQRVLAVLTHVLAAGVSVLLAATSWEQARSALEYADQTQMLRLPLAPVVFFMSAMLFVNALVQIAMLWVGPSPGAAPGSAPASATDPAERA
ncbi:TRAP transporter small permease [Ramlibacter sp. AN1015]|uniref:TRAP transporter small permease n=1 Tax=Ramlibacter sp. AN1015 TaxID=3133428 RepID=UPI0030C1FFC6